PSVEDSQEVCTTSFSTSPPSQDSLPEKLAVHEKNVREFDAFVETLQ
ncbi:ATG13 isoform 7, partial [Pan troglodytes]